MVVCTRGQAQHPWEEDIQQPLNRGAAELFKSVSKKAQRRKLKKADAPERSEGSEECLVGRMHRTPHHMTLGFS